MLRLFDVVMDFPSSKEKNLQEKLNRDEKAAGNGKLPPYGCPGPVASPLIEEKPVLFLGQCPLLTTLLTPCSRQNKITLRLAERIEKKWRNCSG